MTAAPLLPGRRAALGVVVFLVALTLAYLDFRTQGGTFRDQDLSVEHRLNGMDFDYAYSRAMDLKHLLLAYLRDPLGDHPPITSKSIYPPAFMAAFMPLTNILPGPAYRLYCGLLVCCLGLSVWAALSAGGVQAGQRLVALVAAALLFHSYPVSFAIERGNSDLLATALAAGGLLAVTRGSMGAAAICLAASTHVKLYPGILGLLYVVRFRGRGLAWLVGLSVAPLFVLGWSGFRSFASMLSHTASEPYVWPGNHSLYAFLGELASTSSSEAWLTPGYNVGRLVLVGSMALVAARYAFAAWQPSAIHGTSDVAPHERTRGSLSGMEVGVVGACFCLMSLLPTVSHDYQLVVHVVPLVLLLSRAPADLCRSRRLAAAVVVVVALANAHLFMPRFTPLPFRMAGMVEPWTVMKTPALVAAFLGYAVLALVGLTSTGERRHGAEPVVFPR